MRDWFLVDILFDERFRDTITYQLVLTRQGLYSGTTWLEVKGG